MSKRNPEYMGNFEKIIIKTLDEIERNRAWLSRKTNIPYKRLYQYFMCKKFPTLQELDAINSVLSIGFYDLAKMFYDKNNYVEYIRLGGEQRKKYKCNLKRFPQWR